MSLAVSSSVLYRNQLKFQKILEHSNNFKKIGSREGMKRGERDEQERKRWTDEGTKIVQQKKTPQVVDILSNALETNLKNLNLKLIYNCKLVLHIYTM